MEAQRKAYTNNLIASTKKFIADARSSRTKDVSVDYRKESRPPSTHTESDIYVLDYDVECRLGKCISQAKTVPRPYDRLSSFYLEQILGLPSWLIQSDEMTGSLQLEHGILRGWVHATSDYGFMAQKPTCALRLPPHDNGYIVLQRDGNLVYYDDNGRQALWSSNTASPEFKAPRLFIGPRGFVIRDSSLCRTVQTCLP